MRGVGVKRVYDERCWSWMCRIACVGPWSIEYIDGMASFCAYANWAINILYWGRQVFTLSLFPGSKQLCTYHLPDSRHPKQSHHAISPVSQLPRTEKVLAARTYSNRSRIGVSESKRVAAFPNKKKESHIRQTLEMICGATATRVLNAMP